MSSERRILSSRANGALSHGPVTPEGLDRSSRNAERHGLLSKHAVLSSESRELFDQVLNRFIARFEPADEVELSIVEEWVSAYWRMRRLWAIENRNIERGLQPESEGDDLDRITDAFNRLATSPEGGLLHRYESRLSRIEQRAIRNLRLLQSAPRREKLPNEPSPISGHPPTVIQ